MNFSVTAVFTPLERAELKKRFHQQKRMEAQLNKVSQQAARSYKSTLQVKRTSTSSTSSSTITPSQAEESKDSETASASVASVFPEPPVLGNAAPANGTG